MKRFVSFALVICIMCSLALPVFASSLDGMTVTNEAYYIDGSFHQIAINSDGISYYYINGVMQKNKGVVFVNGSYYYVRSSGNLAMGSYFASVGGDLPAGVYYNYDSYGRMIDPPYYPDGWESEWSSVWPFPTEPSVTEPVTPDTPSGGGISSPDKVFGVVNTALVFATDVWTHIVNVTGMWGYYFSAFLLLLLLRYLLRPIFGSRVRFGGQSDTADKSRMEDEED